PPAPPGDRREGGVPPGGCFPCVRRAALRSLLPRLGCRRAQAAAKSAAARQRALHRRRARYASRARSREGIVVRCYCRDRASLAKANPHRTSTPPHRLGRTPRTDEHTAQQSRDGGDRRFTGPVEPAGAFRDPEGAAATVPAALEG